MWLLSGSRRKSGFLLEGAPLIYTGAFWSVDVIGILHGPAYGIDKGYCVMSLKTYCEEGGQ